ncbi:MAG: ABC transporter substrate-binding protein [Spirochaetota bacterium]
MEVPAIAILGALLCLSAPRAEADKAPVVDTTGARITLAAPASRIVSLSPGATESLYAIGSGGRIVAVSDNCDYPDEVRNATSLAVGGDRAELLRVISAARPDLVILAPPFDFSIALDLKAQGIAVFRWDPPDFVALARAIMALGTLTGRDDSAIKAAATLTQAVRKLRLVTDALPREARPRLLWLVRGDRRAAYGMTSLASAMMEAAGGDNVLREKLPIVDLGGAGFRDPGSAVLVVTSDAGGAAWWDEKPGDFEGKVFFTLPAGFSTSAGPRLPLGLLLLAKRLYPGKFP